MTWSIVLVACFVASIAADLQWQQLTNQTTSLTPSPRTMYSSLYAQKSMIIFGGTTLSGSLGDVWNFTTGTSQWKQVATTDNGPQRHGAPAVIVFSGGHPALAVYGGSNGTNLFADGWLCVFLNDSFCTWRLVSASSGFEPRMDHSLVLSANPSAIWLFGGRNENDEALGDLWSFAGSWNQVDKNGRTWPSPRYGHSCIGHPEGILIFGGRNNASESLNDTWLWLTNSSSWIEMSNGMSPSPSPRAYHSAVLASDSKSMIVYGGSDEDSILSDAWIFLFANKTWVELNTTEIPSGRYGHSAVITEDDEMLIFGGMGQTLLGDLWKLYDPSEQIHPKPRDLIHDRVLPAITGLILVMAFVGGILLLALYFKKQGNAR